MTPSELKAARKRMRLSQKQLGEALRLTGDPARSIRRLESGERSISGPIEVAVELMLEKFEADA